MTTAPLTTILPATRGGALHPFSVFWRHAIASAAGIAMLGCTTNDVTVPKGFAVVQSDGTYTGSWNSVDQGITDGGGLTFVVANGVITASASPGVMSTGTVTPSGDLTGSGLFNGHLNCIGGALTVTYAGKISTNAAGSATATGTFTDPSPAPPNCVGSSGPWTATRTR